MTTMLDPTTAQDVDPIQRIMATARAKREAAHEAQTLQALKEQAQERDLARARLVELMHKQLGITVPSERVEFVEFQSEETRHDGDAFAEVRVSGLTFTYRYPNRWTTRDQRRTLCIWRRCTKGCHNPLWLEVEDGYDLLDAMEDLEVQHHQWGCRVEYNEDGDPVTNDAGIPLPKRTPTLSPIELHSHTVAAYTQAVTQRRNLEFQRPIAKAVAIQRIMESGRAGSATAAEKMVETDELYANHCQQITEAVILEITTREALAVARHNAGLDRVDDSYTDWRQA